MKSSPPPSEFLLETISIFHLEIYAEEYRWTVSTRILSTKNTCAKKKFVFTSYVKKYFFIKKKMTNVYKTVFAPTLL